MMEDLIRVIVVRPMEEPEVVLVRDNLKVLQGIVGGRIQECYLDNETDDPVIAVVNEEGKLNGLTPNRGIYDREGNLIDIIYGTFFLCYVPMAAESFMSLSDDLIEKYMKRFRYPEIWIPKLKKKYEIKFDEEYDE